MKKFSTLVLAVCSGFCALQAQQNETWRNNGKLDNFAEFTSKITVPFVMPDGVKMYTDVYLPRLGDSLTQPLSFQTSLLGTTIRMVGAPTIIDRGQQIIFYDTLNGQPNPNPYQLPTIFTRTPYDKGDAESTDQVGAILAILGYNYMLQDMRGRYQSEGVYFPMYSDSWNKNAYHPNNAHVLDYTPLNDPKNSNKHEDGYHSVKVITVIDSNYISRAGRNQDGSIGLTRADTLIAYAWDSVAKSLYAGYPHTNSRLNNGSIGMFGASALGNTQLQLSLAHDTKDSLPQLKCLMPIVATTEHYISTGYNNGVFRDRIVTGWLKGQIFTGTDDDLIPVDFDRQNNIHSSADYDLPKSFEVNSIVRQYSQNKFDAANICIDHFSAKRYPDFRTGKMGDAGYYPSSPNRPDMDASVAFVNEDGESVKVLPNGVEEPLPGLTHDRYRNQDLATFHFTGWWDIFTEGQINNRNFSATALKAKGSNNIGLQKIIIGPWAHQTVGSRTSGDRQIDPVTGRDSRYPENVGDIMKVDLGSVDLNNVPLDKIVTSDLITWFRYNLNYRTDQQIGEPKFILRESHRWQKLDSLLINGNQDPIREVRIPANDVVVPFGKMINFLAGTEKLEGIMVDLRTQTGVVTIPAPAIEPGGAILPALAGNKVTGIPRTDFEADVKNFRLYMTGPDAIADSAFGYDNGKVGNYWLGLDEFPSPLGITYKKWYLHQDGKFNETAHTSDEGYRLYINDPDDPILTVGGSNMIVRSPDGTRNSQSQMDLSAPENAAYTMDREGVLKYESEVFTDSFAILGLPVCTLYAKTNPGGITTGPTDTDWDIRLCDVYPDGRVMFVQEGIVSARSRDWARALVDSMGVVGSPTYANGFEDPGDRFIPYTNINAGEIYEYVFKMMPIGFTFAPGHKMRILISSSNYTRYQVNPNLPMNDGEFFRRKPGDGQPYVFNGTSMLPRVAVQRVAHSDQYKTSINFPVWNLNQATAIKEILPVDKSFDISVFPNPASDYAQIFVNQLSEYNLTITDITGKVIETRKFNDTHVLDLHTYSKGIYFAEVQDRNNKSNRMVKRFSVQ